MGREQPTADPRVWPPDYVQYQPTEKIQNVRFFSQTQKLGYLSSYWMKLHETFTVYVLYMCLYVAKMLGADGKYFWVIFNFFRLGENQ